MTRRSVTILIMLVATTAFPSSVTRAAETAPLVEAKRGMVVCVNPEASDAGLQILQSGGNAVDAAIAVAFALAVTFPEAGNIGGGGFMMIWPRTSVVGEFADKKTQAGPVCIEYRETCPAAVTPDSFVDEHRQEGHHTVGVPGTVRGLALAHEKFGKLPWPALVAPAIRLARDGFPIDDVLAAGLNKMLNLTSDFPEFRRVYGKSDGTPWKGGDRLVQPDLASSLSAIAAEGPDAVAGSMRLDHATRSEDLAPDLTLSEEPPSTTHFSVADGNGMAVANTYTLQNSYGSRVVVRGGGFLLNNEMTDFNWRPGVTTRSGRVGTEPNVIGPGKRMVSSQCPTFVARDGKLLLATGSPGGRTIPSTVLCVIVNVLDFGMTIREAVDAPRWHHQWLPDRLQFEHLGDPEYSRQISELRQLQHIFGDEVKKPGDGYRRQGDAHSILIRDGHLQGASDWRRTAGKAAGW